MSKSSSNELRVFISSTFRDLQEEREHLVKKIFPEIRALCRQRGVTFTDVDLRWGLTEEEAGLGRIIRTCLEEVDKCRPYFIGIIGNRYGWVPELHDILMDPELLAKFPFVEDVVIDGKSVTEMEFIHGVFNAREVDGQYAFFYQRSGNLVESDDAERLGALIERTRSTGRPFREFGDIEELGVAVRSDLIAMIDESWPEAEAPTELELERRAHAAFAASRIRAYIPNPLFLKEFITWIDEGESPLVITGLSGLGKSSLVAYLTEYYHRKHPDAFIVAHYVGAASSSGTAISVIRHIVEAIRTRFGLTEQLPSNPEELQRSFPNWLFRCEHLAGEEGIGVLIVIDAVNQLDETGQRMQWLPETIPPGVKLVVSTTPGEAGERLLEREWHELTVLPLEEERIRQSIIVRYLGEFHKGINLEQLRRVISDEKGRSPLYLRVVAEELRLHGEHETLDDMIERYGGAADLLEVFELFLERMERDYGVKPVKDLLSLIGLSRSGLTEEDLLDLMEVSRLELSRLLFAFDYHLLQRGGLLSFFHDYLRRAVDRRYLSNMEDRVARYHRLVSHFEQADITARATMELLHALEGLGDGAGVDRVLTDMTRFVSIWDAEQYEVLRLWSGRELSETTSAYRTGLKVWNGEQRRDQEQHEVFEALSSMFEQINAWAEGEQVDREHLAVVRRMGDRVTESLIYSRLAHMAHLQGRMDESLSRAREAEALARELGHQESIGSAVSKRGTLHEQLGEYADALACYREHEQIVRELGDLRSLSYSIGNRGIVHAKRGEYSESLACLYEQEQMARDLGDRWNLGNTIGNRGAVHSHLGEYAEALACFLEQEEIGREIGNRNLVGNATLNRGIVHAHRGEYAEALSCYRQQEQIARELGDRRGIGIAVGNRGNVQADLGEYAEALADALEALEIHREIGFRYGVTYWLATIARSLLEVAEKETTPPLYLHQFVPEAKDTEWRGATLRAAREHTDESVRISQEISKPDTLFIGRVFLARITAAEADLTAARLSLDELLKETTDEADRAELHYWLWKLDPADANHRSQACNLYETLFIRTPQHIYRKRIAELREE